jgi:hypothetical protein
MSRLYAALIVVALAYPLGILMFARQHAFGGAMLVGTFTVGASLLLGLPLALWFVHKGWLRLWQAGLAGAVAGVLCVVPFALGGAYGLAAQFLVPFAAVGACHGAVFWLVAIFKNPVLQCQSSPIRASTQA